MGVGEVLRCGPSSARGSYNRMIRDSTLERATAPHRADRGRPARHRRHPQARSDAPYWRDPLLDIVVHAQDIARPLGIEVESPADALVETAEWARWRFRFRLARRRLRGVRLVADDADWSRGEGEELRGPIVDLVLLVDRPPAGLAGTTGPGRAVLEERFATAG